MAVSEKTCVEFYTDGFPSVFGSKRGFQVLIKKKVELRLCEHSAGVCCQNLETDRVL